MALIKLNDVEKGRWYNISLYADICALYGKNLNRFEAKFDGECWRDINNQSYYVSDVIFIDDDLPF